jgi:hypothetical protein
VSQRRRNGRNRTALVLATSLLGGTLHAQAPPAPDQLWWIPDSAIARAAGLKDERSEWVQKRYGLPAFSPPDGGLHDAGQSHTLQA